MLSGGADCECQGEGLQEGPAQQAPPWPGEAPGSRQEVHACRKGLKQVEEDFRCVRCDCMRVMGEQRVSRAPSRLGWGKQIRWTESVPGPASPLMLLAAPPASQAPGGLLS